MTDRLKIGIGFQCTMYTGWGVVGMNIALQLSAMPDIDLYLLPSPHWNHDLRGLHNLDAPRLAPFVGRTTNSLDVLLTAEGNTCGGPPPYECRHMGLMVFEDTSVVSNPEKLANLRKYDFLVTASRWNHELLKSVGVDNTLVMQGVDPTIWHPAPRSGRHRDRFIVFSGGKLEYRKGQDIVLAAFRQFREQHPEALLVTAWQNRWTGLAVDMTLNGHVEYEPETMLMLDDNGRPVLDNNGQPIRIVDVEGWGEDNGLLPGSHFDLGMLPNVMLAPIVREADVAVFASRAEGGTNLMAMECMAAGVRTILSNNTGHGDVMGHANVWPVRQAQPQQPSKFFGAIDGWGETAPAYLAGALGVLYENRNNRRFASTLAEDCLPIPTWADHTAKLVELIRDGGQ